ncbi:MAG: GNAT family N-acetyltransferase [Kiritimatiellia bacterium]|jgi:hypothetical protein|nr:GNAT family N-acetyltransferase [Kiritimatiellia bacterium]MDP6847895.1 GNAT family N-acetyltransferase [Kiritimatiellia bacterium]
MQVQTISFDDPRWPGFTRKFEWANVYHSPQMAQVFDVSPGFEVHPLFALEDDRICAFAMPVLVKCNLPLPAFLVDRIIMFASPLHAPGAAGRKGLAAVLAEARGIARRTAFFLEIRNSEPFPRQEAAGVVEGMKYIPRLNYLLDLTKGEDGLFAQVGTKTRNRIRKAGKRGIEIRPLDDEGELKTSIDMITSLYRRKRVPMVEPAVFEKAWSIMGPSGGFRAIGGFRDEQLVAVRFLLCGMGTVIDWYAASDPASHRDYPNEAMVWHCLQWACGKGYKRFDFGGGGVRGQDYGPGSFKEKFRGETVEFGRYRYSRWSWLVELAEKAYGWRTRTH